jgi:hypothetical protein
MYSFLGETWDIDRVSFTLLLDLGIDTLSVSKISVLHWNHILVPSFYKIKELFSFCLLFIGERVCISTPSCWYDHRYHQTCLECLLSFVEPWIPSFDGMMDDDQDYHHMFLLLPAPPSHLHIEQNRVNR